MNTPKLLLPHAEWDSATYQKKREIATDEYGLTAINPTQLWKWRCPTTPAAHQQTIHTHNSGVRSSQVVHHFRTKNRN